MDQNRDSLKTTNPIAGLPGAVFEKAWEVRWALKLTYVCLFMDMAFMTALGTTLLDFSGDMATVWGNIGRIFVSVVLFTHCSGGCPRPTFPVSIRLCQNSYLYTPR